MTRIGGRKQQSGKEVKRQRKIDYEDEDENEDEPKSAEGA